MAMRIKFIEPRRWLSGCIAGLLLAPWSAVEAGRSIHEHAAVEPQGSIEIVNVAGAVEVSGWDQSAIDVTGSAGENVERVDVTTSGSRSTVRVVSRGSSWGDRSEAHLTIRVPLASTVTVNLVASDLLVKNLQGEVKVQAVSGDISGEVGGDLHATTVSGNVHLKAMAAHVIEVKTVSGDMQITGGGGEVDITTISGDATVELMSLARGRFKSVSGDMTLGLALDRDGHIEGESVSGNLHFMFANAPAADFDVQTVSGNIHSCFGPKPLESRYGPGSQLMFKSGEGNAHVHIQSKSGDVQLCAKGMKADRSAALPRCPADRSRELQTFGVLASLTNRARFRPVL